MTSNVKSAESIYEFLKKLKETNKKEYDLVLPRFSHIFNLTEVELQFASQELKNFIAENFQIVSSIEKYGYTEPYESFIYNFERLAKHIKITEFSLNYADAIVEGEPELLDTAFGYEKNDYSYEEFIEDLNLSRYNLIYEQALISLLTIFEAYINDILLWLYRNNKKAQDSLRVNLTYGQVLNNLHSLLEVILNKEIVEAPLSWKSRDILLKKFSIKWKEFPEADTIEEAIARRNIIIHRKGKIDEKYISTRKGKNNLVKDSLLNTDHKYYKKITKAIKNLVAKIDDAVRERNIHK